MTTVIWHLKPPLPLIQCHRESYFVTESEQMPCIVSEVPVIKEHPRSCSVQLGRDCQLICNATGKNIRYRWYKRTKVIEGESMAVLHIRKADMNDAGRYSCIVSNDKESIITWATVDVVSIISSPKIR